jgi:carbonic anhydrase/acetyltransferase-like protein (isoleucine patch superfamily)
MKKISTKFRPEQIAPSAYLAPGATVVGDVTIGEESTVLFGAVIRGDTTAIRIGSQTNVQDLSVLHADPGFPCELGDRVTIGHGAVVHGATVEDDVMIGIRAVVLNGAVIGRGSLVAAGALVTAGTHIPPGSLVTGMPAKVRGPVSERHTEMIQRAAMNYVESAKAYRESGDDGAGRDS